MSVLTLLTSLSTRGITKILECQFLPLSRSINISLPVESSTIPFHCSFLIRGCRKIVPCRGGHFLLCYVLDLCRCQRILQNTTLTACRHSASFSFCWMFDGKLNVVHF